MSDYQFPAEYSSEHPDRAARQIAAAWIETVLRGNARDLYTTAGWTDAHRKAVTEELRKLQGKLVSGEPIDGAVWLVESNPEGWRVVESSVGTLNPNPWAPDDEQFI